MNKRWLFMLVLVGATFGFAIQVYAQPEVATDEATVQAYYKALNAGDVNTAMTFVAENAVFSNPTGQYSGSEAIAASLKGVVDGKITFELSNFAACKGRVVYDYAVLENGTSIETGNNGLTIVQNGKITFDGTLTSEVPLYGAEAVYKAYYDALNAGDIEAALKFLADDVVLSDPVHSMISGKEAARAYLEETLKSGITFELVSTEVRGNRVYNAYTVFEKGKQIDAGSDGLGIVEDGLIIYDGLLRFVPEPPTDSVGVVEAFYSALNTGDLDKAVSFIAKDAKFINPLGTFSGTAEVQKHLATVIQGKITFGQSNFRLCDGRVVYDYEVFENAASIETGGGGLTIVKDGLITFDGTVDSEPAMGS